MGKLRNITQKSLDAENANNYLANGIYRLASAITPNVAGSKDATGVHVESLTEAGMGVTSGLMAIANAIQNLADAVREHSDE